MRPTIADVARMASVHPGTVSRVLNSRDGTIRVSDKTRQKIFAAAEALKFYPDHAAQSLARASTNIIGVYIYPYGPAGGLIGDYHARIINGIEEQAYAEGYDLLLMGLSVPERDVERCRRQLYQRRVDGLIVAGNPERTDPMQALISTGKPIVGVDCYGEDIGTRSVNIDNMHAAEMATEYLISLGHRKIGFIGSPARSEGVEERLRRQGYERALKKAGIPVDPRYVINGGHCSREIPLEDGWCVKTGQAGLKDLRQIDPGITGILCMNDQVGAGALHSLHEQGLSIPRDFSVVGFDDSMVARYTYPPLTSVKHHLEEMGRRAVKSLLEAIREKKCFTQTEVQYVGAELVIRASTGPARAT